jgi:hypothetical protein
MPVRLLRTWYKGVQGRDLTCGCVKELQSCTKHVEGPCSSECLRECLRWGDAGMGIVNCVHQITSCVPQAGHQQQNMFRDAMI